MATPIYIDDFLSLSVALIPATETALGLGAPLYLLIEDASPLPANPTSVSSTDDVDTLLAATQISSQAADDLTAMLSQSPAPATVYLASYDTGTAEDPSDALATALAAEIDFGVIAQESRTNTDNSTVGTWLASGTRRWRYVFVAQSSEATLLTSGKPAGLSACEVESCVVLFHSDDTEPEAAAHAGKIAALSMFAGPIAQQQRLLGVALPTLTSAELTFLKANGGATLLPLTLGAGATERAIRGTITYGDQDFTPVATIIYAVERMEAGIESLVARKTIEGRPLLANEVGDAEIIAALDEPLSQMASVGHFQPGQTGTEPSVTELPDGYQITIVRAGAAVTANVLLRLPREVASLTLPIVGKVV